MMENNEIVLSAMESEKKKIPREILPLYKRIGVIESAAAGLSHRQLAEKFKCGRTQISNILRNKDDLMKEWEANNHKKSAKRKRRSIYENVNILVSEWYKKAITEGQRVSTAILQEKALEYAEALNFPAFKASNGWLDRMRKRYGILCNAIFEEEDTDNTSKFEEGIQEIIEGYDPQDIYNIGETGLLFRTLPDKSLIEKAKQSRGGKLLNERLTIGFCCNAVGEKEIPIVITRSKESSFKEIDFIPLGIKHKQNIKAWMTSEIFEEWISEINERMRNRKKKVLILVDYAPCHPEELSLSNVTVKCFPPNPFSPLQPLDQGIIQSFKILYRKYLLKKIFSQTSNPAAYSTLANSLTLFDVARFIKHAWNEVSVNTIQRCFSTCGLSVLIPQSNGEDRSLNELKLICNASQITDCVFYEDVEFCEDLPSDCGEDMETDSSASKEANSDSSESDGDESEGHLKEFKPYTVLEAFEAIGRLKATFKTLGSDKLEVNDKLEFLEFEIQNSVVEQKVRDHIQQIEQLYY